MRSSNLATWRSGTLACWLVAAASAAGCADGDSAATTGAGGASTGATESTASSNQGGERGDGGDGSGRGGGPSAPSSGSGGDATSAQSTASSGDTSTAGVGGGPEVDPCSEQPVPACDTSYPTVAGQGLVPIHRCAFPMGVSDDWAEHDARITSLEGLLPRASVATVLADLNRTGSVVGSVPGLGGSIAYALRWNDEDEASTRWFPQGLTGSPDASPTGVIDGKRVVLVSSYDSEKDEAINKGARIAFADVTGPGAPTYRYALLVETTGAPGAVDIAPVPTHAGGIAWVGHYLYVAQTGSGFRVFDTDRMLQVETDVDAIGCDAGGCTAGLYKYVIPQVGSYLDASSCNPLFSYVALDATSDPPALVSGEYCSGSACAAPLATRLFRWPLDPSTGLIADAVWPTDAYFQGERQVQGGITIDGVAYLSSSTPAGAGGELYRATTDARSVLPWSDTPEDLMYDPTAGSAGWLWGLSEGEGARFVYAVDASSLEP